MDTLDANYLKEHVCAKKQRPTRLMSFCRQTSRATPAKKVPSVSTRGRQRAHHLATIPINFAVISHEMQQTNYALTACRGQQEERKRKERHPCYVVSASHLIISISFKLGQKPPPLLKHYVHRIKPVFHQRSREV